jgi:para-nitrobenzyl esterase
MQKLAMAATTLLFATAGVASAASTGVVQTTYGPIQGSVVGALNEFLGVPYAAPPVGSLRWTPPAAPTPWTQTIQTTSFGNFCPQGLSELSTGGGNEDCLYLNVYTPSNVTQTSNLPVMVWLHGGGLTTGSGQEYDPTALVQTGNVVVVTLNYRLGVLGFLAHPALAAQDNLHHSSGNYGTLDQQFALAWVRANISQFGGNPNSVTIFGESAGGQSVITQLYSPLAGKLHAAIIESGAYTRAYQTQPAAQSSGSTFAASLGCTSQTDPTCLRALSATQLVTAQDGAPGANLPIAPNVDNWVLTQQPFVAFANGQFQHVPVIDGSNHDEYRLFVSENDFFNLLGGHPGGYTPADYTAMVDALAGNFAPQVLAKYPLSAYPSPNYAISAVATDYAFSCGALLLDALLAKHTTVYAYEFNDVNPPNVLLPADPYMTIADSHAIELDYLFPEFKNIVLNLGPADFTPAQQVLGAGMQAAWTSFAKYGRPLNPHGGAWDKYSVAEHAFVSLIAPSQQTETNFYPFHNCGFWGPFLLNEAGLPPNTKY